MTYAPEIAVLIPTYQHANLIAYAIRSVLAQTFSNLEVLVVGDGADEQTGRVVLALADADPRVRWFPNDKGPGHGEVHRHAALQETDAHLVAYCSDDDLWFPHHAETLRGALANADFVQTLHCAKDPHGDRLRALPSDLSIPSQRTQMLRELQNHFGPSVVGHRMDAYRSLPEGWRTKPPGVWSDLHMWRQFLAQEGLIFATVQAITTVHMASAERRDWTADQREDEIASCEGWIADPVRREFMVADALAFLASQTAAWLEQLRETQGKVAELETQAARERQEFEQVSSRVQGLAEEVMKTREELAHARAAKDRLEYEIAALTAHRDAVVADLLSIIASESYRLGRALTSPARTLRRSWNFGMSRSRV